MNKPVVEISKFLSFVLRHNPQSIGITLDAEGWMPVDELLAAAARHGQKFSREQMEEVVATNDKKRVRLLSRWPAHPGEPGPQCRGRFALDPVEPPDVLYHGTVDRFLDSIRAKGLIRGKRHHVHLSADRETAAARRPAPRQTHRA